MATATKIATYHRALHQKNEMIRVHHEEPRVLDPLHRLHAGTKRASRGGPGTTFKIKRKRLERTLLLLRQYGARGDTQKVRPKVSTRDAGGETAPRGEGQFFPEQIQEN